MNAYSLMAEIHRDRQILCVFKDVVFEESEAVADLLIVVGKRMEHKGEGEAGVINVS